MPLLYPKWRVQRWVVASFLSGFVFGAYFLAIMVVWGGVSL